MRRIIALSLVCVGLGYFFLVEPCLSYQLLPFRPPGGACTGIFGSDDSNDTDVLGNQNFQVWLKKINIGCTGNATSVQARIRDSENDTREVKLCIYNDDGGSPSEPDTLHSESAPVFGFDPGWATDGSYTPNITSTGNYWVGIIQESSATEIFHNSAVTATNERAVFTASDFNCPATAPAVTIGDDDLDVYVEY